MKIHSAARFARFVYISITLSLILNSPQVIQSRVTENGKLLIISLDGFRHDFLDASRTETLWKLSSEGVRAKSLTSSYITKTFPNHYSIATGLYEESHGIVANYMWDPVWKESFKSCSNKSCGQWYGGEPIWNTNELNNINRGVNEDGGKLHKKSASSPFASGVIYWPGSNAEVNNRNVTFIEGYLSNKDPNYMTFPQRLDKIISWFTHSSTPINLGVLYYENPDSYCHRYGPESIEVQALLREIDGQIKDFLSKLKARDLSDLNVMIVSDHGFADVDGYLYLEDCIDSSKYNLTDNTPIMGIWPYNEEDADAIYKNLTECEGYIVHRKNSAVLKEYHYSSNRRISPIIVSTPKSADGKSAKLIKQSRSGVKLKGNHGWNSTWERMHGIFIARGPAFKEGYVRDSFENVNIYPLMCEVLGIVCPDTNGSLAVVNDMLDEVSSDSMITRTTVAVIALTCSLLLLY